LREFGGISMDLEGLRGLSNPDYEIKKKFV